MRIRLALDDGAFMDVSLSAEPSPELLAAIKAIGVAAVRHMDALEAVEVSAPNTAHHLS